MQIEGKGGGFEEAIAETKGGKRKRLMCVETERF